MERAINAALEEEEWLVEGNFLARGEEIIRVIILFRGNNLLLRLIILCLNYIFSWYACHLCGADGVLLIHRSPRSPFPAGERLRVLW